MRRPPKAYENPDFLKSPDARTVRILCEYLEPLRRFQRMNIRETIVLFGSSRARPYESLRLEHQQLQEEKRQHKGAISPDLAARWERMQGKVELSRYYEEAAELSALLTRWAKSLNRGRRFVICSGGGPGIMEAANRGATERAGGLSVGLTISLPAEEAPNPFITPELISEFHYFFMRKLWFIYLAVALVVFPGGFGTMDELFETLTLIQTRKVSRPLPVVLYGGRFWKDFLNFDALVRWGTISPEDLNLFQVCDTPREAFEYLKRRLLRLYPRPPRWDRRT